jgi:hypothetical protein
VKWEHDRLVCVKRVADMKGSFRETVERLDPPPEAWERFWARIDSLGVWQWKSDYNDPKRDFPDGESWSLALRYRANQVKSKGYNAVPEGYSSFRDAVYKLMEKALMGRDQSRGLGAAFPHARAAKPGVPAPCGQIPNKRLVGTYCQERILRPRPNST